MIILGHCVCGGNVVQALQLTEEETNSQVEVAWCQGCQRVWSKNEWRREHKVAEIGELADAISN